MFKNILLIFFVVTCSRVESDKQAKRDGVEVSEIGLFEPKSIICANESVHDGHLMKHFATELQRTTWRKRHPTLLDVYKTHSCFKNIEIGVARGELAHFFMKNIPNISEYHLVDPFMGGYDINDSFSNVLKDMQMLPGRWANSVLFHMHKHGCTVRLHFGPSMDMATDFQPQSMDCIFIDGDHTYDGVKKDIVNYHKIVKPGGLLVFDDYSEYFPGVVMAVDEFVAHNNLKIVTINDLGNVYVIRP